MKITLYKYYKRFKCDTCTDAFEDTKVLTERELREKFIEEYKNFHKDNISQYECVCGLDISTEDARWTVFDTDICTILDIFCDNDMYDEKHDYCIEQCEIDFYEYEDCYD